MKLRMIIKKKTMQQRVGFFIWLVKLTDKQKNREDIITKIKNETKDITIDYEDITKLVWDYYKLLYL